MMLHVLRADPAGNITLFVLDRVEKNERAAVAAHLMRELPELKIEQVGFACLAESDVDGHMEMMGGEFCGNATRAYAMHLARERGRGGTLRLRVSGCAHPVTAEVDLANGTASAEMPCPCAVYRVEEGGCTGTIVNLGGIAHLVTEAAPSEEFFRAAEPIFQKIAGLEAYGVMFLDRAAGRMTPLVKVVETGTLVWEGSCGSGSVACAVAESDGAATDVFVRDYIQPAGTVRASVERRDGEIFAVRIGRTVSLGEVLEVSLTQAAHD